MVIRKPLILIGLEDLSISSHIAILLARPPKAKHWTALYDAGEAIRDFSGHDKNGLGDFPSAFSSLLSFVFKSSHFG
jgi:hypothetical protein